MRSGRHLEVENRECRARERRNRRAKKVKISEAERLGKSKVSENKRLELHILESHWVVSSRDSILEYCWGFSSILEPTDPLSWQDPVSTSRFFGDPPGHSPDTTPRHLLNASPPIPPYEPPEFFVTPGLLS